MVNSQIQQARWRAGLMPVLLAVQFLVSLDMSVVNVALPAIGSDLGFGGESLTWVVNAYALTFGGLLMLGGRLADIVGRRRVLMGGFAVFGAASLAGGLVGSPGELIAARAVQGVGAACLAPVALALITANYPAGAARSRALGLWGAAGAVGGAVGVLAGGLLTDWAGWRAVMLINVPVVIAALAVARYAVPTDRHTGTRERLDLAGALLVTAGTTALVFGLVRTQASGWTAGPTLGTLAGAVLLFGAFAITEARVRRPLLRLGILAGGPVLAANVFTLLMSAGQIAAFYFTSLYMQQVLGYGPTATGYAFLPFCAGIVVGSALATRLMGRVGARALLVAGGLLGAAGFAWFALAVAVDGGFWLSVLGPSAVASVGIGMCFVPVGTAATTGVAAPETGMASGLLNSSRQVGGAVGLAVLVTVAASATGAGPAGRVQGFSAAFWLTSGLLAAASVAAAVLHGKPQRRLRPAKTLPGEEISKVSGDSVETGVSRSTHE
ncbi:MFS transporter [Streptomyces sp. NPDC093544]|uniref:MFS transporter n=1 Tax=Streptomyces sp. NPDC093544 TaxID=3155200 RepID=UPI003433F1BE